MDIQQIQTDKEILDKLIQSCRNSNSKKLITGLVSRRFDKLLFINKPRELLEKDFLYHNGKSASKSFVDLLFNGELSETFFEQRLNLLKLSHDTHQQVSWIYLNGIKKPAGRLPHSYWIELIPQINPTTCKVVAFEFLLTEIICINTKFVDKHIFTKFCPELTDGWLYLGLQKDPYNLTTLQHEILFMFSHGYSTKQITVELERIYKVTRTTNSIYQVFHNLLNRLELNNRDDLISWAVSQGYAAQAPISLIPEGFINTTISKSNRATDEKILSL